LPRSSTGSTWSKPGIEVLRRWRPDDTVPAGLTDAEVSAYGGIGRKG